MRTLVPAAVSALALFISEASRAQSATSLEVGVVTAFEDLSVFQLGFRSTSVKERSAGVDFAIAIFPEGLAEGLVLLTPDLDVTAAISIGVNSWLLPRVGVSALVGYADGEAGALPGLNVGIGVLGATSPTMGVRMDLTYRRYLVGLESAGGLLVVSVGLAWMRRR